MHMHARHSTNYAIPFLFVYVEWKWGWPETSESFSNWCPASPTITWLESSCCGKFNRFSGRNGLKSYCWCHPDSSHRRCPRANVWFPSAAPQCPQNTTLCVRLGGREMGESYPRNLDNKKITDLLRIEHLVLLLTYLVFITWV